MKTEKKFSLVIDIGNSNIVVGLCEKKKILATWRFPTEKKSISAWAQSFPKTKPLEKIVVSSVVPTIHAALKKECKRFFKPSIQFLSAKDFPTLTLKVKNPSKVGIDRLVNAAGARKLSKANLLIIDIGTATTFDIVTSKGEFLGGVIAPGPQTINLALFEKCSQLPKLPLLKTKKIVGTETKSSIQSGVFYGYLSLLEGMIEKIKRELQIPLKVILTGGPAPLFSASIKGAYHNPQLTLQGLMASLGEI